MSNTADDGRADGSPPSTAEFTPERVLSVFQDRSDQAKPLTATDVMDALGCSRKTAHNKLDVLVERGDLETRKVGARSRVWWIPFSQLVGYLQNYVVFMAAPIFISLSQVDEDLLDASETLRGNPAETFVNVVWPLSKPGVAIGSMFVFVLSIGNFIVPQFLSGGESTVSTLIYLQINNGLNYPAAAALSIALLAVIFSLVFLLLRTVDITDIAQ